MVDYSSDEDEAEDEAEEATISGCGQQYERPDKFALQEDKCEGVCIECSPELSPVKLELTIKCYQYS